MRTSSEIVFGLKIRLKYQKRVLVLRSAPLLSCTINSDNYPSFTCTCWCPLYSVVGKDFWVSGQFLPYASWSIRLVVLVPQCFKAHSVLFLPFWSFIKNCIRDFSLYNANVAFYVGQSSSQKQCVVGSCSPLVFVLGQSNLCHEPDCFNMKFSESHLCSAVLLLLLPCFVAVAKGILQQQEAGLVRCRSELEKAGILQDQIAGLIQSVREAFWYRVWFDDAWCPEYWIWIELIWRLW